MKEYTTDQQTLEDVIAKMEEDLTDLRRHRKKRSDKGVTRPKYSSTLPPKYKQYIASANKRGLTFDLTVEQFEHICSLECVYCGSRSKIGVDRVDSTTGYTIDNTQPCCTDCNMMKFRHSEQVFLQHIAKIYRHRFNR